MRNRQYQKSSIKTQETFLRRRLDGIGLDTVNRVFLAIEFKRTQDARSNYVERAAAAAQDQHQEKTCEMITPYGERRRVVS
jgi:hypothetical protein